MAKKTAHLQFDEDNIKANEEEALAANRTKILEPKTPYHELEEDGETPAAFPPKAPPAKAGGPLRGPVNLEALANAASAEPRPDNFESKRKDHYTTGGMAALRAKAQALDEEEDD